MSEDLSKLFQEGKSYLKKKYKRIRKKIKVKRTMRKATKEIIKIVD